MKQQYKPAILTQVRITEQGDKAMKKWWLYQLTDTDRTNIVCFVILTIIAIVCGIVAKRMKLPVWKLQVGWISVIWLIGVALLIVRLSHG